MKHHRWQSPHCYSTNSIILQAPIHWVNCTINYIGIFSCLISMNFNQMKVPLECLTKREKKKRKEKKRLVEYLVILLRILVVAPFLEVNKISCHDKEHLIIINYFLFWQVCLAWGNVNDTIKLAFPFVSHKWFKLQRYENSWQLAYS